jgi:hypothetical protein
VFAQKSNVKLSSLIRGKGVGMNEGIDQLGISSIDIIRRLEDTYEHLIVKNLL